MWWLIGSGFVAWLVINWACAGPQMEAWQARNNFRMMNAVLIFLMVLLAVKAHGWHIELVTLIPRCQ